MAFSTENSILARFVRIQLDPARFSDLTNYPVLGQNHNVRRLRLTRPTDHLDMIEAGLRVWQGAWNGNHWNAKILALLGILAGDVPTIN